MSIGSPVFEKGHVVILGWLENQRDEEVLWKLLSQVRHVCQCCLLAVVELGCGMGIFIASQAFS